MYRRDQDDLTLIDLPGITRIARAGQGTDGETLERKILGMCRRYCEPDESVILNVVSAMVDFSTSASLQLSQQSQNSVLQNRFLLMLPNTVRAETQSHRQR